MGVKIKKKNIKKVDKKMVEKKVGSKKVGEKNQKIKKKSGVEKSKQAVVEVCWMVSQEQLFPPHTTHSLSSCEASILGWL